MEPISGLKMQIKSRISQGINHRLETFFNAVRIDGLKIEHITEEKYKDKPERKNGVRRERISFPKEVENIIGSL
ncbi:hypothetical protein BpHYR1_047249 [Brachionus plicatilis]|uniref:RNA-directed DNA polymerase from mobile element jockey-like n=1 Tax=Brachionus plicatilis TaxID=10195 RepID=A0A3M7R2G8_BRAPC|nr:hypothetical protein BpHYR1_047249 [Brachionus plicatilis]